MRGQHFLAYIHNYACSVWPRMTELGTVTPVGRSIFLRRQTRPHSKGSGPQRPQNFSKPYHSERTWPTATNLVTHDSVFLSFNVNWKASDCDQAGNVELFTTPLSSSSMTMTITSSILFPMKEWLLLSDPLRWWVAQDRWTSDWTQSDVELLCRHRTLSVVAFRRSDLQISPVFLLDSIVTLCSLTDWLLIPSSIREFFRSSQRNLRWLVAPPELLSTDRYR